MVFIEVSLHFSDEFLLDEVRVVAHLSDHEVELLLIQEDILLRLDQRVHLLMHLLHLSVQFLLLGLLLLFLERVHPLLLLGLYLAVGPLLLLILLHYLPQGQFCPLYLLFQCTDVFVTPVEEVILEVLPYILV